MSTARGGDQPRREPHLDTLALHAGQPPDPATGAVAVPIVLASTFAQSAPGEHQGFSYTRSGNPNRAQLEASVAALEGGAHGYAFASGSAASATLLQTLRPGQRVVATADLYGGTYRLLEQVVRPLGVDVVFVDVDAHAAVQEALATPTALLWLESPTNPLLKVADIRALAALAHAQGTRVVVDNTFATPMLQRPLALGADVVVHSTTKFINGHSDVLGGVLVTSDVALAQQLGFIQNAVGAVPSPFDCYLTLRGIKTLPVRMARHCDNAEAIAGFLSQHPQVEQVHFPGLPSHPQHALAQAQMARPGAVLSVVLRADQAGTRRFLSALRLFSLAESLGGVESLVSYPPQMSHAALPRELRLQQGITDSFVRISAGLEHPADLMDDLDRALSATK
ncbi:MAG: PLP-dependent transferase [Sandaracinaceae bacterium]|jgi:cystathionine beta-lyase/cystathionine gamma-synthase|nr:PLP-dependent transferase [Sandaracinaceae bacterium]MBK6808377.1 PLP-dependent transferase [Sandaracinaceae bacterium]MBK7154466.1 PLP-dependent transferase [Sandaracinaceae bacterium]MBK7777091.1 PLP-dependent transferase [Sandaracinaceae bacterium]MBK8411679.1 PLP-dependent transferase [Sandaracinaceae bacterium]